MNKTALLRAILTELENELRRQQAANEQASAGATDGEARAETKWDTCGLEASYLARGHALQFKALAADVHTLRAFTVPVFTGLPAGLGALIEVEIKDALFSAALRRRYGVACRRTGRDGDYAGVARRRGAVSEKAGR
jgi:hypothetical protein